MLLSGVSVSLSPSHCCRNECMASCTSRSALETLQVACKAERLGSY